MARDGAHERAVLALRAQRGVDLPERAGGGRRRADPHEPRRELGGHRRRDLLVDALGGLGDEDDVDVGDVVELAAAGLAHGDDGEARAGGIRSDLRAGDDQGRLERGLREVGERTCGVGQRLDGVVGREVESRDAEQLFAVGRAEHVDRRHLPRRTHGPHEPLGALGDGEGSGLGDGPPVVGVGDEVVAQGGRAAEHGEHPLPGPPGDPERLGDRATQSSVTAHGLHEPHEAEQGTVGVGHRRQRLGQPTFLDVLARVDEVGDGRVLQQRVSAGRVVEPQPRDGDGDRSGTAGAHGTPVRAAAGSARARRRSPCCGSRPTRRACCAGRTRTCARRGSRRRARCSP